MKPAIPITDPKFQYVPAARQDVRKLFERVRAEQAAAKQSQLKPWARVCP